MPGEGPASASCSADQGKVVNTGPSPCMTTLNTRATFEAVVSQRILSSGSSHDRPDLKNAEAELIAPYGRWAHPTNRPKAYARAHHNGADSQWVKSDAWRPRPRPLAVPDQAWADGLRLTHHRWGSTTNGCHITKKTIMRFAQSAILRFFVNFVCSPCLLRDESSLPRHPRTHPQTSATAVTCHRQAPTRVASVKRRGAVPSVGFHPLGDVSSDSMTQRLFDVGTHPRGRDDAQQQTGGQADHTPHSRKACQIKPGIICNR